MLYSGTDPESYITEYTLVYEDKRAAILFRGSTVWNAGTRTLIQPAF